MNRKILLSTLLPFLLVQCCVAQQKPKFAFPEDVVADSSKKTFARTFNEGFVLYKLTCASCHNKTVNGKLIIPDFSIPQLMDYEMRIFPEHNGKMNDDRVSDEEMAKIIAFLRHKERSGPPPPPEKRSYR